MTNPLLTLENIRSGAFPPDAHAVGFLLGEIERLREVLTIPNITPDTTSYALFIRTLREHEKGQPVNAQDLINALMWRVKNQRKEIARLQEKRGSSEPNGVLTITRELDEQLSTLNAAQTARLKAAIDYAGLTPKQWERFMNSFMDVEYKSPTDTRAPLPPDILANAQQDVVHQDAGAVRAGRSVKLTSEPRC